jgi:GNAT superfamily N-acetyltransferase
MSETNPAPTADATASPRPDIVLRRMKPDEADEVAALIHLSTNYWYESRRGGAIFRGDPSACRVFPDTYEALDPGCCVVAVHTPSRRIVGSCFFHPRPTHVSVGIVNTHPSFAGRGIARRMLDAVISEAGAKPVRLVSSLLNLDSFSLYTRAGFVPRQVYQDLVIAAIPDGGLPPTGADDARVRPGVPADAPAIAALEREIAGIERENDWRFFGENPQGIWHVSVLAGNDGALDGALASVTHPASTMIGPGVARTEEGATALLRAELNRHAGKASPLFLVPADAETLVAQCYRWGARNSELHTAQVRGAWQPPQGIVFPTFLPETG